MFWRALLLLFWLGAMPTLLLAQSKAAKRYEIEAKRMGVSPDDNEALPRSREFLRIDSTYYVGWYFEGAYRFNHAADFQGYKACVAPLEKALTLLEKDFSKELSTRSSDLFQYYPVFGYQNDYTRIAYYLYTCYSNIEDPNAAYALLRRVIRWNFERDLNFDVYNYLGWLVHRNRFYTNDKYAFLKNNLDENERLALAYLDSGLLRIKKNFSINQSIFGPDYQRMEFEAVYHYKSILYSYGLQIDSAEHYYGLLKGSGIFPHNNYGTFKMINAQFREAEEHYQQAVFQESGDKRLKEWAYYQTLLKIYKGQPKQAISDIKEMINAVGSTPGYGWYNIALARAYFYDGQIEQAEKATAKAAGFNELHIGTTLGQSHYNFSIQLEKLLQLQARIERLKFEKSNWWYTPSTLLELAKLTTEKYAQQFLIISQFAENPERDRVVYKLFSTESTVIWDEVWFLIKDFSSAYFIKKFENEIKNDPRPLVKKYFQLFVAKLKIKEGKYAEAKNHLQDLALSAPVDSEFEHLFEARVQEALAMCLNALDEHRSAALARLNFYNTFPQLVPLSSEKPSFILSVKGQDNHPLVRELKKSSLDFSPKFTALSPKIILEFVQKDKHDVVRFTVLNPDGQTVIPARELVVKNIESTSKALLYGIFGTGGNSPDSDSTGANLQI